MSLRAFDCEPVPADLEYLRDKTTTVDTSLNPWTSPCPTHERFGSSLQVFQHRVKSVEDAIAAYWLNVASALVVPIVPPVLAFLARPTTSPSFNEFWIAYFASSIAIAFVFSVVYLREWRAARRFRALLTEWARQQEDRTTPQFWTAGIRALAQARLTAQGERPNPHQIDNEKGHVFTEEIAALLVGLRWMVRINQRAHDYGVDIFACAAGGRFAVLQCKHYTSGIPSATEFRELLAVAAAMQPDLAVLVCLEPARQKNVQAEYFVSKGAPVVQVWHIGHLVQQARALCLERTGRLPQRDPSADDYFDGPDEPRSWFR